MVRIHNTATVGLAGKDLRRRKLFAIGLAALAIRIALISYFDTWHTSTEGDHWSFGFETGRVARSLAERRGFASPFLEPTGPTAWLAPGYPWLLSLLFRIFGIYTPAAALAALLMNSFLSAVTCPIIYILGRAFYDEPTGMLGAALFALSPTPIWHTITTIWDVTASALLLALLVDCLRRVQGRSDLKPAVVTGLIAGLLALFNPACLIVYLAGGAWICLRDRQRFRSWIRLFAVLAGVPALICLPWMVRNALTMHLFTLKSNFGTELRIGNNPLAPANPAAAAVNLHPTYDEFALYRELGESGYVAWCRREALTFIKQNPAAFLQLLARRVLIFWTGSEDGKWTGNLKTRVDWSVPKRLLVCGWSLLAVLGLAAGFRARDHMLLLLAVVSYPLPYYVTHTTNRYRLPLDPVLAVLAAHALVWAWRRWRSAS